MGVLPGSQEVETIAPRIWSRSFLKNVSNCHASAPYMDLGGRKIDLVSDALRVGSKGWIYLPAKEGK